MYKGMCKGKRKIIGDKKCKSERVGFGLGKGRVG